MITVDFKLELQITSIFNDIANTYYIISMMCVLLYDIILMFNDELSLIWRYVHRSSGGLNVCRPVRSSECVRTSVPTV